MICEGCTHGMDVGPAWLRLTPADTDLDADLLARLAQRTQHRDADCVPIMRTSELAQALELERLERGGYRA
jgi:hypothetical protein